MRTLFILILVSQSAWATEECHYQQECKDGECETKYVCVDKPDPVVFEPTQSQPFVVQPIYFCSAVMKAQGKCK